MATLRCLLLAFGLALSWTTPSAAQTPTPAPAAGASEQLPDFSGTWILDRRLSNDPTQVNFEAPPAQLPGTNTRRGSFGVSGFGGRGGYGQNGGSRNRNDAAVSTTPEERARLAALTDQLKTASATLTIAHHDPTLAVSDALGRTITFQTTASRDDHTLGAVTIASTSHWEGGRILVEYAISDRRTLVYTYTLLQTSHQMVLRVRPQFNDLPRVNGSELKLVYSLAK